MALLYDISSFHVTRSSIQLPLLVRRDRSCLLLPAHRAGSSGVQRRQAHRT